MSSLSHAATYWVSPNGNNSNPCTHSTTPLSTTAKQTIAGAHACALTGGDTVYLRAGTYNEQVSWSKGGTSAGSRVTLASAPGETAIIRCAGTGQTCLSINTNTDNLIISRLEIDGADLATYGVYVGSECQNIRFEYNNVHNSVGQGVAMLSQPEVNNTGYEIIGNTVHDIHTAPPPPTCVDLGQGGCHAFYLRLNNPLIERNVMYNNEARGLSAFFYGPNTGIVRYNVSYDNGDTGFGIFGTAVTVHNNIAYNTPSGKAQKLGFHSYAGSLFYNNVAYGHTQIGFYLQAQGGPGGNWTNNIAMNTTGYGFQNDTTGTVMRNNLGFGNTTNVGQFGTFSVNTGNLLGASFNPQFVNAPAGNFHIQSTSAARDVGFTITTASPDFDGVARPQGGAYDIGAYEFVTPTDTSPPTVTGRTPASGATSVSLTTTVTATFNEAMNPSTITASTVTLKLGASSVAASVSYAGTTATLTPTSNLTQGSVYTVTIEGGAGGVADAAGNLLAADDTWTFTTTSGDSTPPTVTGRTPAPGATGVALTTTVTVTFDEAMHAGTITPSTFELRDGTSTIVPATRGYGANTATLTPNTALVQGVTYTVTVKGGSSGVWDAAGNPLAADDTWTFSTTATDTTPPTITARTPAPGASGVSPSTTVTVTFNEAMSAASITTSTITLDDPSENPVPISISYNAGTLTATLTPNSPLAQNATYAVTIESGASGVKDAVGNPLANDEIWLFTTGDTVPPTVTGRVPAPGATDVAHATTIIITFSEPMDLSTFSGSTVILQLPTAGAVATTQTYGVNTLTLTPVNLLTQATLYTVIVKGGASGVRDLSGNPLAADDTWTFITLSTPCGPGGTLLRTLPHQLPPSTTDAPQGELNGTDTGAVRNTQCGY